MCLRRLRKTDSDDADVTCCGRLFQTRAAATGNARSPMVDSRVRRTISDGDEVVERSSGMQEFQAPQLQGITDLWLVLIVPIMVDYGYMEQAS